MNKQSEEDYLDQLLNSVNEEEKQREMVSVDREFLKELQMAKSGQDVWKYGANRFRLEVENAAKGEAEFLREFEQELKEEELDDIFKDFDDDVEDFSMEELINKLRSPEGFGLDKSDAYEPDAENTSMYEPELQDLEEEEPDLSLDFGLVSNMDSDLPNEEVIDLADLGEEDLISLLAGTEDLADIGALLSQNDNEQLVEVEDAFAAFASSEMSAQSEAVEAEDNGDKKKKSKKGGLLDKLTTLLFGKDTAEEERTEKVSLSAKNDVGVEFLSDENAQILAAFADVDELEAAGKAGGKNKKDKKDKKKESKPKKVAKPKAPKPPKVKKPKEKDNTPPLPKGPVVLVCMLAVSIFVLVYFSTELLGYHSAVSEAKAFYRDEMYAEAANSMSGLNVKKGDKLLHDRISTLAAIDGKISSYKVFMKHDRKAEAIDALICAAGRCEVNVESAEVFTCTEQLSKLKDEVAANLQEQFGMSYEEAIELYELTEDSRTEYTIALNKIMEELGIK